jgi:hypothetical protein
MNESERRFNDQFRETLTERNERLRTGWFKERVCTYQKLVAELSDALTDEGGDWSIDGLHDLRCRVANALPLDMLPDWLRKFRDDAMVQS